MAGSADLPARRRSGGLLADAAMISVITVAARLVGFGRIVTFARTVGPTCLGDVYTTANTIPNIVFDVVAGGALTGLVVPAVAGRLAAGDREGVRQVAGALLGWALLLLVPVSVAGGLLAGPLMSLLVGPGRPGCDRAAEVALGGRMLEIFAPQIVLYGVGIVATGVLQARRRFLAPALAPLLSSLVAVGTYLVFSALGHSGLSTSLHIDTTVLAGGTTLGVVVLSLPLLPAAWRGVGARLTLRFPPGVAATVRRLALAGAAVLGSQQIAAAVALRLANGYGEPGTVVAWNLGWTVFVLPWAVVAVPIATSAFPTLTVAWEQADREAYGATLARTIRVLIGLALGAAAALVATAEPLAHVLVAGAPGSYSPPVLARAIVAFAPGVVGFGLLTHLSRARFARGDARGPALATALGWAVMILAALVAVPQVGPGWVPTALAGSVSLGTAAGAAVLLVRVLPDLPAGVWWHRMGAAVAGWGVAAGAGWLVSAGMGVGSPAASVGVALAAGAVVALIGGAVLARTDPAYAGLWRRWWPSGR